MVFPSFQWWTWHDLNVRPRPSQSRALIPLSYRSEELAEAAGVEPAHAMRGDLANRCHTVRRRLQHFQLPIANCRFVFGLCFWFFVSLFPKLAVRRVRSFHFLTNRQSAIGNRKSAMT